MIYVAAGDSRQYENFIREQIIPLWSFKYLHDMRLLMGLENPKVVVVGTWYEREDYQGLQQLVLSRWRPTHGI